jgi:hypothetical protein
MKKIILLMLLCFSTIVYSQNNLNSNKANVKGVVFTDKLKVRNAPSLKSNKIDTLEFGDVITFYEISGSGEYKNGTLDKWVKISDTEDQWVNYFYVIQFPAKLEYENKSEIHAYNWESDVNNVYDQLPERIIIEDIIEENNKKYFVITIDDNDYYHNDLHNIKVEMNSVIKNFLPESYSRALRRIADRKLYLDFGSDCWYELGENGEHIIFEEGYLPEGAVKIGENEWLLESSAKNLNIQGLKVQDNISLRKYNFCINSLPILRKKSITENTVLEYGIKLGMSKKDLIDILGLPDKIENEDYLYENYTTGYGDTVIINIVNDKISDISYSIEK